VAHLHHHVVGEVDQVVDGAHAHLLQAVAQPLRRGGDPDVEDTRAEARAEVGGLDGHVERSRGGRARLRDLDRQRPQRRVVQDRHLARHPVDVHAVHAVGGDVELEDGIAAVGRDAVHGQADLREVLGQARRRNRDRDVLLEPGKRDLHASNCSRKRRSPS
jgi:hypothetical protein